MPALLTSTLLLTLIHINIKPPLMNWSTEQRDDRSHCLLFAQVMPVGKLSMFRKEGRSGKCTQERS